MAKGKRKIIPNAVRRKVRAFVTSEQGQVSKQSVVTLGAFLGSAALGAIIAAKSAEGAAVKIEFDTDAQGKIIRIRGTYV